MSNQTLSILSMILILSLSLILLPQKYFRKIVHIVTGFTYIVYFVDQKQCPIFPVIYPASVLVLYIISLLTPFLIALPIALSKNNKPYPFEIIVYFILIISYHIFNCDIDYGMALCALIGGDGLAGFSQFIKSKSLPTNPSKSYLGLILTIIGTLAVQSLYNSPNYYSAIVAALAESLPNVSDNFTVTVFTYTSFYYPVQTIIFLMICHLASFLFLKHKLTKNGSIFAIFMLTYHLIISYRAFYGVLTFGVMGIVASQFRKKKRQQIEKSITSELQNGRSAWQAFDNSIASIICLLLFIFTENDKFVLASIAASAECLGDTFGSDIGCVLSSNTFHPVKFYRVKTGINGGVSLEGTLAGFVGILLICLISQNTRELYFIFFAAVIGFYSDSLIGMYLQYSGEFEDGIVTCPVEGSKSIGGIDLFSNSAVNVISSMISALVIIIFY